jgi:hypothetical protein
MSWCPFDNGNTLGLRGSEDGVIIRDDEHQEGARITLERDCAHAPFAMTCGIYGWFFHTRFFGSESGSFAGFERMKEGLTDILSIIPRADDPEANDKVRLVCDEISNFVRRFP